MKLSEAAQVLGVSPNAEKQEIEKAARQQIRKWHPDRWRNASEAEQKKAADEYSKVSKAQKVLQHPETADPEMDDIPSPSRQPNSSQQGYGSRPASQWPPSTSGGFSADQGARQVQYGAQFDPTSSATSQGTSPFDEIFENPSDGGRRIKYNSATNFEDSFGAVPDTMEQSLNTTHNEDTMRQYKQVADAMKMSMSIISSTMMFLVSFILLLGTLHVVDVNGFVEAGSIGAGISSIFPPIGGIPSVFTFGILTLFALLKVLTYDAFVAPLLANKIDAISPSAICGIDITLCGIIGYAVSSAWPVPRLMYGCMILIGILFAIIAFIVKMQRDAE